MKPLDLFSTHAASTGQPIETTHPTDRGSRGDLAPCGGVGVEPPPCSPLRIPASDLFSTGLSSSPVPPPLVLPVTQGDLLLHRYEIQNLLGAGGMGIVYRALDRLQNRLLALKFLRPSASEYDKARLLREVEIHETLSHPTIVRCYGLSFDPERQILFLATEYVPGRSLQDHLDERRCLQPPFSPQEILPLLEDLSAALDHAHSKGVIHRDLKPANVLLTSDLRARLLDFGIARTEVSSSPLTQGPLGSAYYMAPEQLQGHEITPAADIYSLGILLHHVLTGSLPQPGMPSPSRLLPSLPPALDPVLAKALRWQPRSRFSKATDLLSAFRSALTPRPFKASSAASPASAVAASPASAVTASAGSPAPSAAASAASPAETSALILPLGSEPSLWDRLQRRIDRKRPSFLEHGIPRHPPLWTEPLDPSLTESPSWPALPPLAKDLACRWLLSRDRRPLLPMLHIPKGDFFFGASPDDPDATAFEKPGLRLSLDGFWIARIPVTYGVWQIFLDESRSSARPDLAAPLHRSGFDLQSLAAYADHPVTWLSFEAAWAFCDFYGLSLPSEAEWEKAARGSSEPRRFPWGDGLPTPHHGAFQGFLEDLPPVGHFPLGISPYGLLDTAGGVQEWTADAWDARLLSRLASAPSEIGLPPRQASQRAAVRGGHLQAPAVSCRVSARLGLPSTHLSAYTGFRPTLDLF